MEILDSHHFLILSQEKMEKDKLLIVIGLSLQKI